jgi:hypothetical protein
MEKGLEDELLSSSYFYFDFVLTNSFKSCEFLKFKVSFFIFLSLSLDFDVSFFFF